MAIVKKFFNLFSFDRPCANDSRRLSESQCRGIVIGLFLLAVGLQILYYLLRELPDPDEIVYLEGGILFAESGKLSPVEVPPLFTMMLGALAKLGPIFYEPLAISCCSVLCALRVIGVYGCACKIWDNQPFVLGAAFCAAIHPTLVRLGGSILRDAPYLGIYSLVLWIAAVNIAQPKLRYFLLLWLLAFLGMGVRKEGIELLIFVVLALGLASIQAWISARKRRCFWLLCGGILLLVTELSAMVSLERYAQAHGSQWRIMDKIEKIFLRVQKN